MPNAPARLKQSDLTRYAKAMQAAQVPEYRVVIHPDRTVEIIVAPQHGASIDLNDWDS